MRRGEGGGGGGGGEEGRNEKKQTRRRILQSKRAFPLQRRGFKKNRRFGVGAPGEARVKERRFMWPFSL